MGSRESFVVHSPLAKYLKVQRAKKNTNGEWHRDMDDIVAKDYAILARFRDRTEDIAAEGSALHDYFLAGLRGLGTWGAAWFIDHRHRQFESLRDEQDFQLLLEVEYRSGRIHSVTDVSRMSKRYFQLENSLRTVANNVREYRQGTY